MNNISLKLVAIGLFALVFSTLSSAGNIGHRVAAGHRGFYKDLPENSIIALKAALIGFGNYRPLQLRKDFIYVEFDLQETADGKIVLFHDKDFSRMLPNEKVNKAAFAKILSDPATLRRMGRRQINYKDLMIKYLTLEQIKSLSLYPNFIEKIPTLKMFLEKSLEWNIQKPMTFEIKYFQTDLARKKLIDIVKNYKDIYRTQHDIIFENEFDMSKNGISFLAFKKNLKRSFPLKKWCPLFRANGFKAIYRPMTHSNLCR